ncbi:hypothetical protein CWO07_04560 [Vibrio splendidus]|uniref:Uncharacterized protein n=2 Tax=Vibrionaceae TaxID=641 RepID=A0A2T5EZC0_VIBSP|nr:hypothetical protein CWO07_04560 [Vibrio splendidus]
MRAGKLIMSDKGSLKSLLVERNARKTVKMAKQSRLFSGCEYCDTKAVIKDYVAGDSQNDEMMEKLITVFGTGINSAPYERATIYATADIAQALKDMGKSYDVSLIMIDVGFDPFCDHGWRKIV